MLDVEVGSLDLEGALAADGESGDGPTATEPAPFDYDGGGGAGGSVLVHAATISGGGSISADGGDTCITTSPPLFAGVTGCGVPLGSSGGGGGGRVALYAGAECSWHGTLHAAGGVDSQSELAAEKEDAEARRGGAGSVFFPAARARARNREPEHHEEPPVERSRAENSSGKTERETAESATRKPAAKHPRRRAARSRSSRTRSRAARAR